MNYFVRKSQKKIKLELGAMTYRHKVEIENAMTGKLFQQLGLAFNPSTEAEIFKVLIVYYGTYHFT